MSTVSVSSTVGASSPAVTAFGLEQIFETIDRDVIVRGTLEEQTFMFELKPNNDSLHHLKLEFTKDFARELRDWLVDVMPLDEN